MPGFTVKVDLPGLTIEDTLLVFRAIKGLPHRELVALAQEFQNEQGEFSIGSLPC